MTELRAHSLRAVTLLIIMGLAACSNSVTGDAPGQDISTPNADADIHGDPGDAPPSKDTDSADVATDLCTGLPDGAGCDDNNPCTLNDVCQAGACVGGNNNPCDDQNACTLDSCDIATGCAHTPTEAPCNDEDPCTGQDACQAGTCVGISISKEGPVCNNVDDDCDGSTDEDCTFGIGGVVMGGGFVTATDDTELTMEGSSGTRRFVGTMTDGNFTLMSGLPPRGEEN